MSLAAKRHALLALLMAMALCLPALAGSRLGTRTVSAQAVISSFGPEVIISQNANRLTRTLDATWHAATGQFLSVWSEHPDHDIVDGVEVHRGDDEIRGRLVNLDGSFAGSDFLISSGGNSKDFPQVEHVGSTLDPAEQLSLVVWSDRRDGGDDIWGQLIAPAGNALQGANFKISGADRDLFPELEYGQLNTSSGVFLVVWEQETSGGESDIQGQVIQGAGGPGSLVGGNFRISEPTTGRASAPAIAFDPVNDQFLVVWRDDRNGASSESDVWGQLVDGNGNNIGTNFRISSQAGFEFAPIVEYHSQQQEFLVVWDHLSSDAAASDVHARRVAPNGTLLGTDIDIAVTSGQEESGDIGIDYDTGNYIIPLNAGPTRTDRNSVEVVRLTPSGTLVGNRDLVSTDTSANKGPIVAVYGSTAVGPGSGVSAIHEMLIMWRDARNAPPDDLFVSQVFGRMIDIEQDSDGDGLLDRWETSGFVDLNNNNILDTNEFSFATLPAANQPNVNHKDLYVEVDWMDCAVGGCALGDTTSQAMVATASTPTSTPIDDVITVFANAPIDNADGIQGITLHVDVGQMGGGGPIANTTNVDFYTGFEAVKAANFNAIRAPVFRYALRKREGSGRAEIWGNDFWWRYNTQVTQATGFMHELGHTLGLRHGGGDNINCKPNYFSIMSYTHQLAGIPPTMRMDYSRQVLPQLDESSLNEATTLGGGNDQTIFSVVNGGAVTVVGPNTQTAANISIDWDNDGTSGEAGANVQNNDLNRFDQCRGQPAAASPGETLTGFNDWANIRYNFRSSPNYAAGIHIFYPEDGDRSASENFYRDHYGPPGLELTKTAPASAQLFTPTPFNIVVRNTGPGPARNVVVDDIWPAGLTYLGSSPAPALNIAHPDGTRTLQWHFDLIAPSTSVTMTIEGMIQSLAVTGLLTNTAVLSGENVLGEFSASDEASTTTEIVPPFIYMSFNASGTLGGISFKDDDIMAYDPATGQWRKAFSGERFGLTRDIDGFTPLAGGGLLLSFQEPTSVPGLGRVDDSDIVKFVPLSPGDPTQGQFEWYLDGSDVGLTTEGEDIDALGFTPEGRLIISTKGDMKLPGFAASDEDLVVFNAQVLGAETEGTWELYFDGSDLEHPAVGEDISGVWVNPFTHEIYIATQALFSPAENDEGTDIYSCAPVSVGENTICHLTLFWDGADHGLANKRVDGLTIGYDLFIGLTVMEH